MAGYPKASGMGASFHGGYIPEIWSGKTLVKFYASTVFGSISNTDYEGEITKYGDVVHIRTVPDLVINDYVIGQKLVYENPQGGMVDLDIDKGKTWSFAVDDIEKLQADIPYVEKWTDDAGQQLGISIDTTILADVYSDADSDNVGLTAGKRSHVFDLGVTGDPVLIDKTNITDWIVDMGTVLDEQDVPGTQRWLVLPALFCGMIKKSELKDASISGDGTSIVRNGRIGIVDRFTIYSSNNMATLVSGTEFCVMAGHPSAITFASQLVKNETLRNPDTFGDLARGLQVFGYKVVKGTSLVTSIAKKAA